MVEDYLTENTIYLEIRTSPRILVGDGTTIGEYVRAVTELIAELNKHYAKRIVTKLILSIDRSKSLQEGRMIYELAKQYQYVGKEKVIVGMDFAGNPQGGRFEDFRQLFETIRDDGFNITVHIAEAKELSQSSGFDLEDDETSTILQFLPDRLGHFLHMKNSHFVKLSELNQREETTPPLIEICPTTSLYLLGLSSYSDHPHIRKLLKHNYPFSLNTDDSGIFSSNITQEILHMYYAIEMRLIDVVRSLESSIEYAFIPGEEKRELQDRLWKGLIQLYSVYNRNEDLKELFAVTNSNGDEVDMSSLYTM
eukprot:gene1206-1279_t